jgi:alpha-L-fucosidase 2
MENATVSVEWTSPNKDGEECIYSRKTFVSRKNDIIFTEINYPDFEVSLVGHDPETCMGFKLPNPESGNKDGFLWFAAENNTQKDYGAVAKIETDGQLVFDGDKAIIKCASKTVVSVKTFIEGKRKSDVEKTMRYLKKIKTDFDMQLSSNKRLHKKLFSAVSFNLAPSKRTRTNEQLLLEAYDGTSSDELIEKLWSYGRYLFICATREDAPPCNLVGLWNGTYASTWAINMFNVNYEMIYWQALQNGLEQMLLASFDYIEKYMADKGYDMQIVYDSTYEMTQFYGVSGYPTTFIYQPDETMFGYVPGYMTREILDDYLERAANNERQAS